ncbi:MAG TPA: hypothetical protein VJ436_03765 [Anaerolineales bacterium]|nr:hypothetical protein [Anaerolineales bacterium]
MKKYAPIIFLVLSFLLAGCSAAKANEPDPTPAGPEQEAGPALDAALSRYDEQGAISVTVTPISLEVLGESLEFDVVLDTHSVDLGMDLAPLATLGTDSGMKVQALKWDAQPGGHHVQGTLVFPASVDGKPLLDGVSQLTMTIKELDATERVFTWEISP